MRYVARRRPSPRSWDYDDDEPFRPCLDVDGPAEVDTGLVTTDGDPIYRVQDPIGFGREHE